MKLNLYHLTSDNLLQPISTEEISSTWQEDDIQRWLDIEEIELDPLKELLAPLSLHPLVLEECLGPGRSPLVAPYENALMLEFLTHTQVSEFNPPYLVIIVMPSLLLTIQKGPVRSLKSLAKLLSGSVRLAATDIPMLLYHIFDYLIDHNLRSALKVRNQIDKLGIILDEEPDEIEMNDIRVLKRQINRLTLICEDQKYCVTTLLKIKSNALDTSQHREYFRDLVSDAEQALRFINQLETRQKSLHEHYQLLLHDRADNRLKILTILSAIFLPLTLISSLYGMNFETMPELRWSYGYPLVLILMFSIATGMLLFFYHRGWFD